LRPVVDTINQYGRRIQRHIDSRKRFIEDAAHQLRTPMTLLSTQLHYAASLASTPELQKILAALSENRQQITQLVNQLLSLSQAENYRAEQAAPQPLDLNALVHEVLVELAPLAASRDIDLGIAPERAKAQLSAPRPLLRAMLFNLVDNAIRYTPPGGSATVSVTATTDHRIRLEIADSGPGIPPELRTRVFERFNRGNTTNQEGTGLGLAIVKEAAAACGGTVTLETGRHGKGLRAIVEFRPSGA
jgi:two-component system sensor histidine kinase TctE